MAANSFRNSFQYRAAAMAGMFTQVFWGLIMIMVLDAFYKRSSGNAPISLDQAVTYIWLGQAFLSLLPWSFDRSIQAMIYDGRVSYDFVRPQSVYWLWFARTLGWRTASATLRAFPLLVFAVWGMKLLGMPDLAISAPAGIAEFFAFALSLFSAAILGTVITMMINVSMIWTVSGVGTVAVVSAVVTLFSGMVVPLPLFPGWTQKIISILPFRGLVDVPFRLYSGHLPVNQFPVTLLHQWLWTIGLALCGMAFLKKGAKALAVQGG